VTQATDVFYVETARDQNGEPLGEFRLVRNGCTYAHAKARSTLCTLRDLLNAPRCLEGQTVEAWNGERAVVMAVKYDSSASEPGAALIVRKNDNSLAVWGVGSLKVVTPEQEPTTESEVSP
jgi:hypothetical protein